MKRSSVYPASHSRRSETTYHSRILTKSIILLTVIAMLLPFAFGCDDKTRYEITATPMDDRQYQLGISKNGEPYDADLSDYRWEVSDRKVASLSGNGILKALLGGYVTVRAIPSDAKKETIETELFLPYRVTDTLTPETTHKKGSLDDTLVTLGKALNKKFTNLWSFVITDNDSAYLCSTLNQSDSVVNAELLVICDWTNEDAAFTFPKPTQAELQKTLCDPYANGIETDSSALSDVISQINVVLNRDLPNDQMYYFGQMDPAYEYRVVVRGNYTYEISDEHYMHGLVSGLFNVVKDLIKGKDWATFKDRFTKSVTVATIKDVENIRICIERRPK